MAKGKGTRPRVYARLRPMFGRDAGGAPLFKVEAGCALEYKREDSADVSRYTFDKVFDMESKQEEVFSEIGEVALDSLRKGFNSTIMAYGQTGSGKTFSMEGAKDSSTGQYTSRGLIPRIFESVFGMFKGDELIKSFEVSLQFIELYNEQLQDLLGNRRVVDVTGDPTGGYQCKDAVRHVCKDPSDAQAIYNKGCAMRATASTKMNESSSRSHALLQLSVSWVEQRGKSHAQLNLVDLAGSEGMKKTGAEGKNAKEGIKINLSLTKLALTVKCLAEGSKHIPYRESKLTMMLAKGLGGNNMLHIILALSNSREQIAEGTACLRFGQSCLSMTVNPNANKLEKEQAEMKAVIKEQMQEISTLQEENEALRAQLEEKNKQSAAGAGEIPDFLIAKHIEVNKEALEDDLKEAAEQIDDLKASLEAKRKEREALLAEGSSEDQIFVDPDAPEFAGLNPQQKTEAMEAKRRELMVARIKAIAENEQEQKGFEGELAQLLEIQTKLEAKMANADASKAAEEERIRAEVEEKAAEEMRAVEEKAAAMEAALKAAEQESSAREQERLKREQELEEELRRKEETMKREEELREQMSKATAEENAELQERMARLTKERQEQDAEIERARAEASRVEALQKEAAAAIEAKRAQEEELAAMRGQIEQMARDADARAQSASADLKRQIASADGGLYEPAETMIQRTEVRMERQAKRRTADPMAVSRILETLPVLSACNDLRALTDLEPANRTLFQSLGGIHRLIDYMRPKGQNAPYATIVARTLPCVMDKEGRRLFHEYAASTDPEGEVRYRYLLALLQSSDPDDKENACLAIAAAAQDADINRQAFFEFGISAQVFSVLQEQSQLPIPRQRLQRVVVMAMGELANAFDPYKALLRTYEGVPLLLSFLTPSHDEYLIKETLQLLGRMTQNNPGIQAELQKHAAVDRYSNLLFAQMHDNQIPELAALALVNLCSEMPACLQSIESHPRYGIIRYELLASMARALSASMLRNDSTEMSLSGSDDFRFWGSAVVGQWKDGNAGGDRKHTTFVENPQFLLRATPGTNLCIVLQDTEEASREQARVKTRPLFLRLCVTSASEETLRTRMKQLDINSAGTRPAAVNDESGVVMLEPNVQAALDISKTREVSLRCHVKSTGPEDAWVVIPHVGCSHQHSRFVLAVFADREVKLEGELTPWHRRVVSSSWSPLCSAPRGIADGMWRNCPQFQLINVGSTPTTVAAFLSYAERDVMRNKRHASVSDPPGGMGAEERPLLSLYVMKSKVPDKRFVGTLSPYVEEYVSHSVVTNSWCVSTRWQLEPGDVYAVLAVMAEGTTHEVPMRLTLFTTPQDATSVLLKPLSLAAEWHLATLEGTTDDMGCTQVELLPQAVDGTGTGGSVQAALVMETSEGQAFCSIATDNEGVPHKMLTKYQQQQAVLSVPFTIGSYYTMTTRCITAKQENLSRIPVRLYIYSTRPMQASPVRENIFIDHKTKNSLVSRATADQIKYGEESEPEDLRRQMDSDADAEALQRDPQVLQQVISELEGQRDTLYEFTQEAIKGGDASAVVERLRQENSSLVTAKATAETQLREARAIAAASGAAAAMVTSGGGAGGHPPQLLQELEATKHAQLQQQVVVAEAKQQIAQHQHQIEQLNIQLKAAMASASGDVGAATAALQAQLTECQRDLYAAQSEAMKFQQEAEQLKAGGNNAAKGAPDRSETVQRLRTEVEQAQLENRKLKQQVAETPKSSACLLQ